MPKIFHNSLKNNFNGYGVTAIKSISSALIRNPRQSCLSNSIRLISNSAAFPKSPFTFTHFPFPIKTRYRFNGNTYRLCQSDITELLVFTIGKNILIANQKSYNI